MPRGAYSTEALLVRPISKYGVDPVEVLGRLVGVAVEQRHGGSALGEAVRSPPLSDQSFSASIGRRVSRSTDCSA
jgi:hypothetical protein